MAIQTQDRHRRSRRLAVDPTTLGADDAISYVFGTDAPLWRCMANLESSMNPRAGEGTAFIGLLQIWNGHCPALIAAGIIPNCDALYNSYYNCRAAAWVFGPDGGGCGAWPVSGRLCGCSEHLISYEPPPPAPAVIMDGTLATYDGAGAFWIIANGQRRRIVSTTAPGDVFRSCGYSLNSIQSFSQAQVLAMPAGFDITGPPDCPFGNPPIPEGILVTYPGAGGAVWVIARGQRRRIISRSVPGDVFAACGYNMSEIRTFPELQVVAVPAGADITGPPDCPFGNPHSYTIGGQSCKNNVTVEGWLRNEIAIGHVTAADAQALVTTYHGNLDTWFGTVAGRRGFTAVDMVAAVRACAG